MTYDLDTPANHIIPHLLPCRSVYDDSRPLPPNRTFVVLGSGRGGTTMVAGTIAILGVQMNNASVDIDEANAEDLDILAASQGREIIERDGLGRLGLVTVVSQEARLTKLTEIINHRNHLNSIWGFKDPSAYIYLEQILCKLRNPRIVVVYRDIMAIAERELIANAVPIQDGLQLALDRYGAIQELVRKLGLPTLFISYERAKFRREKFVRSLSEFLEVDCDDKKMAEALDFISPEGGYKNPPASQWHYHRR